MKTPTLPATDVVDARTRLISDVGDAVVHRCQHIPDEHMELLKEQRDEHRYHLDGMTKLCEIPQATADRWLLQGFDIYRASAREIIAQLRKDELDHFVIAKRY